MNASDLARTGRADLLAEVSRLSRLNDHLNANVSAVQARCTALVIELRAYRASGICLPGWTCYVCKVFNGAEKETLTVCRCCGAPK